MHIHDLIGVGFGPSNIALAIALEEHGQATGSPVQPLFIEKQPGFAWHAGMMLDGAHMQVSFMKDLATPRNPASRYTFMNYLHQKRRLHDFINLKTFYPSRQEFNDYLGWAADQFSASCAYGEEVVEVSPEKRDGAVPLLRVRSRQDGHGVRERLTRSLVLGVGGRPNVPACFRPMRDDPRVLHSSNYLNAVGRNPGAQRVAVVGAGQSAAELFMDLHGRLPGARIDLITRARVIRPSDDSPFVNEVFNPEYTDYVFNHSDGERAALLEEFWHTNYAAPDLDLIQRIYGVFYQQKVTGAERHRFLRRHEIERATATPRGVRVGLKNLDNGQGLETEYDMVVLATGYKRDQHRTLLEPLMPYLKDFGVDRDYRLLGQPQLLAPIFVQGCCEPTHGLSDTLLSVLAIRTDEITSALSHAMRRAGQRHDGQGGPAGPSTQRHIEGHIEEMATR